MPGSVEKRSGVISLAKGTAWQSRGSSLAMKAMTLARGITTGSRYKPW